MFCASLVNTGVIETRFNTKHIKQVVVCVFFGLCWSKWRSVDSVDRGVSDERGSVVGVWTGSGSADLEDSGQWALPIDWQEAGPNGS